METSPYTLIEYKYRLTKKTFWLIREQNMLYIDGVPPAGNRIDILLKISTDSIQLVRVTMKSLREDEKKWMYRSEELTRSRELVKVGTSGRFNLELDGHMNETIGKSLPLLTHADAVVDNTGKSLTARSEADALNAIFLCLSKNFKLEEMAKRYLAPEEQIVY